MCGIAGLITDVPLAAADLAAQAATMAVPLTHRGPDGSGVWADADAGVALAHRRLAVVDLSKNGAQPMTSSDGRYVLTYNGEIYNHRDLLQRLTSRGLRLRGHSDTEVLLETIAQTSLEEALTSCNGMFALALWDRHERVLTLARDRLGEKPLYYSRTGRHFLFGSELSALRAHREFTGAVNAASVELYLRRGFVPGPWTIYRDVFKLQPGHVLRWRAGQNGPLQAEPYWSLETVALRSGAERDPTADDATVLERAESLLQRAVELRMAADVPLGAFLSGGVDSSLVVALMQRAANTRVRTFTVSVGGQFDEAEQAGSVARYLGTDHTPLELSEHEAVALAAQVPTMYDEPFADPSAIPTALMSAAARDHVTVCLTGDGGDEMLAGYNRYLTTTWPMQALHRLPEAARSALATALLRASPSSWDTLGRRLPGVEAIPDIGTKLHKLARVLEAGDARAAYERLTTVLEPDALLALSDATSTDARVSPALTQLDALHHMLYLDGTVTLPDDMLVKVDRASMAASLECRVPLLDHQFVEFVWALPARAKLRGRRGKWLLRELLSRHLPTELIDRPKRGFDPPMAEWLRGPLRDWAGDLLNSERLRDRGLLEPDVVGRMWREHLSGVRNHDYGIWAVVVLEAWLTGHRAASPPSTAAAATTTAAKSNV